MAKNKKKVAKKDITEKVVEANGDMSEEKEVKEVKEENVENVEKEEEEEEEEEVEVTQQQQEKEEEEQVKQVEQENGGSEYLNSIIKERDEFKQSYDNLLSKLSSMKSVFSKMKEAQSELEVVKEKFEISEAERKSNIIKIEELSTSNQTLSTKVSKLTEESSSLNSECDRLSSSLTSIRREFQQKEETLLDEKYSLENVNSRLNKKIGELKLELQELKLVNDENDMELKTQQNKLEEFENLLHSSQVQVTSLEKQLNDSGIEINKLKNTIIETNKLNHEGIEKLEAEKFSILEDNNKISISLKSKDEEILKLNQLLDKIPELENDVKNKQLLVGKLRHEAVILNEHLTKSLTMLKQQLGSPNNTIDKELISNVVVSFLQFPRGDPKKFEALQLISALLGWDESKKIAAGLSQLNHQQKQTNDLQDSTKAGNRESFVNLWTDFLERESSTSK